MPSPPAADDATKAARVAGMWEMLTVVHELLTKQALEWHGQSKKLDGRVLSPREYNRRQSQRNACMLRADELMRFRKVVEELMEPFGGLPVTTEAPKES